MDNFVAACSKGRRAHDKLGFAVNEDLRETLSLALFKGAADLFHGDFCNKRGPP